MSAVNDVLSVALANPELIWSAGGTLAAVGAGGFGLSSLLSKSELGALREKSALESTKVKHLEEKLAESKKSIPAPAQVVPTMRTGVDLLAACTSVGLVDIEWRSPSGNPLPPFKFYETAQAEVLVFGISCWQTLMRDAHKLVELCESGIQLRMLLADPNAPFVARHLVSEGFTVANEINRSVERLESCGLLAHDNFECRQTDSYIVYTAAMIDGDISCAPNARPKDQSGQVRIQQRAYFASQHAGYIAQFGNGANKVAFEFIAEDLRKLWRGGVPITGTRAA